MAECPSVNLAITLILSLYLCVSCHHAGIRLFYGGGFRGVLVAITRDAARGLRVQEADDILQGIRDYFTEASEVLFVATGRRVYLSEINILVPDNWPIRFPARGRSLPHNADVIVDVVNPVHGNGPYTRQLGGCGEPGQYIHLTTDYLRNVNNVSSSYGPPGKVLAHEWGHLRWGLFDEYVIEESDDTNSAFYLDNGGNVRPSSCHPQMRGHMINRHTSTSCTLDPVSRLPGSGCIYKPEVQTDVKRKVPFSSFMHYYFLSQVTTFCGFKDLDLRTPHNIDALNEHNERCESQSAWQVMRRSLDFRDGRILAWSPLSHVNTTPAFHVTQDASRRLVVVMDTANDTNKHLLLRMREAASIFLRDAENDCLSVGLIQFGNEAIVLQRPLVVTSPVWLDSSLHNLTSATSPGRCIACGLAEGLKLLQEGGHGGVLVLLAAGEDEALNEGHSLQNVSQDLLTEGATVEIVLMSTTADHRLLDIAEQTGGKAYYAPYDDTDSDNLSEALFNIGQRYACGGQPKRHLVSSVSYVLKGKQSVDAGFHIAPHLGRNTSVSITCYPRDFYIRVNVTSPDGQHYLSGTSKEFSSLRPGVLTLTLPADTKKGTWLYHITTNQKLQFMASNETSHVHVVVTSLASSETPGPVPKVETRIYPRTFNLTAIHENTFPVIQCVVSVAYVPVGGATVTAQVRSATSGHMGQVILRDDGIGADNKADDGVYAAYYVDFRSSGIHSVQVQVNITSAAQLRFKPAMGAFHLPYLDGGSVNDNVSIDDVTLLTPFVTFEDAGVWVVTHIPAEQANVTSDIFPPAKVKDLRVTSHDTQADTLTLQFTAMGDDLDVGKVSRIDLRYCASPGDLRLHFSLCRQVAPLELLLGNLSQPVPAGHSQILQVDLARMASLAVLYFGVKLVDDIGNESPVSNLVFVVPRVLSDTTVLNWTSIGSTSGWTSSEENRTSTGDEIVANNDSHVEVKDKPTLLQTYEGSRPKLMETMTTSILLKTMRMHVSSKSMVPTVSLNRNNMTAMTDAVQADAISSTMTKISDVTTSSSFQTTDAHQSFSDAHQFSTDTHQGSTDAHQASTDARQASTDAHQASTDTHQASSDAHQASTDAHQSSSDAHQASTDAHQASTEQQSQEGVSLDGFEKFKYMFERKEKLDQSLVVRKPQTRASAEYKFTSGSRSFKDASFMFATTIWTANTRLRQPQMTRTMQAENINTTPSQITRTSNKLKNTVGLTRYESSTMVQNVATTIRIVKGTLPQPKVTGVLWREIITITPVQFTRVSNKLQNKDDTVPSVVTLTHDKTETSTMAQSGHKVSVVVPANNLTEPKAAADIYPDLVKSNDCEDEAAGAKYILVIWVLAGCLVVIVTLVVTSVICVAIWRKRSVTRTCSILELSSPPRDKTLSSSSLNQTSEHSEKARNKSLSNYIPAVVSHSSSANLYQKLFGPTQGQEGSGRPGDPGRFVPPPYRSHSLISHQADVHSNRASIASKLSYIRSRTRPTSDSASSDRSVTSLRSDQWADMVSYLQHTNDIAEIHNHPNSQAETARLLTNKEPCLLDSQCQYGLMSQSTKSVIAPSCAANRNRSTTQPHCEEGVSPLARLCESTPTLHVCTEACPAMGRCALPPEVAAMSTSLSNARMISSRFPTPRRPSFSSFLPPHMQHLVPQNSPPSKMYPDMAGKTSNACLKSHPPGNTPAPWKMATRKYPVPAPRLSKLRDSISSVTSRESPSVGQSKKFNQNPNIAIDILKERDLQALCSSKTE